MVFLIQTFPQVHSWSENKLQSLANIVFSSEENSLLSTSRKLLKLNSLFITDINHWIEVQEIAWELFWRERKKSMECNIGIINQINSFYGDFGN